MIEREVVKQNQAEPDPRKRLRMYSEFYVERAGFAAISALPIASCR